MKNFLNFLDGKKQIHLIGVGGSGMYPLAQILHSKGYNLTGSDNNQTDTLDAVRKMGIKVFMGHSPDNITGADLIIHSAAISSDNAELKAAKEQDIPVIERSELLGLVTSWYNKAICISGTHGKTTASSMLTHILLADNLDISAVIGGKLKLIDGSGRTGTSDIMVCEACEFSNTFLKLHPSVSVILNIDKDHLDCFGTMKNLINSFTKFCNITKDVLVVNSYDKNTMSAVNESEFMGTVITFGMSPDNDYYPMNIENNEFDLFHKGELVTRITLAVYGEHNILNAVAACATALFVGCSAESLSKGLSSFTGAGRRFEELAVINGITVVDDYAHHPAEVTAVLKTAKTLNYKRVWAVHQPFTFSRTYTMLDEFAEALKIADKVTLTEIMGGREVNNYNVFAKDLAEKIPDCDWFSTFFEVSEYVSENARDGDLIITMGCGDVNKVAHMIIERLRNLV
ncbi:MAG: UDP-N-acetylmuramate--L-alanine ligase [Oscillospiraceae bacterium]|nr:UDP-N-acetylmuramate--L-alanine ligase [Oscillospiraceae bacterium]